MSDSAFSAWIGRSEEVHDQLSRNLVKRIAREIFRRQRIELPAMDLVVRLNAPVAKATRAEINLDLLSLLQRLPRQ